MLTLQSLPTPFYLLDETLIVKNLQKIKYLCDASGAQALLALKCFASHGVFDVMRPYLHGTTSSSLYEVRLGNELFGGETHAYSVAYSPDEIDEVVSYADKIIFNSISQLKAYGDKATAKGIPLGLRLNPKISNSSSIIADPARPYSRLGEHDVDKIMSVIDDVTGVMIHYNCENSSFDAFSRSLDEIESRFEQVFARLDWVSLGGGIHYIGEDYPLDKLATRLKDFATRQGVQVYLEPGEACVHQAGELVVSVLDVLDNDKPLVVVDAATEAHMLDLLIYRETAPLNRINDNDVKLKNCDNGTIIYGKTCLSGDIFGEYSLDKPLDIGDRLHFGNAAAYTLVKKNWFNGVNMPNIVIRRLNGDLHLQKTFGYQDYKDSLS